MPTTKKDSQLDIEEVRAELQEINVAEIVPESEVNVLSALMPQIVDSLKLKK